MIAPLPPIYYFNSSTKARSGSIDYEDFVKKIRGCKKILHSPFLATGRYSPPYVSCLWSLADGENSALG
jgi:hypothetical protein